MADCRFHTTPLFKKDRLTILQARYARTATRMNIGFDTRHYPMDTIAANDLDPIEQAVKSKLQKHAETNERATSRFRPAC